MARAPVLSRAAFLPRSRTRGLAVVLAAGGLAACERSPGEPAARVEIAWCESDTRGRYDPQGDDELAVFPDDVWTRDDPGSPTGQRVDVAGAAWLDEAPTELVDVPASLASSSGFGRLGGIILRFRGAIAPPSTDVAGSLTDPGVGLWDLSVDPPERVPFLASVLDDADQLLLQPIAPLRPGARHVAVVTTSYPAAAGGCIAPSPAVRDLLSGAPVDDRLARVGPRYRAAVEAIGLDPADVSAMTVFTTHDDVGAIADAAADVASQALTFATGPTCAPDGAGVRCSGTFVAADYRTDGGAVLDGVVHGRWELPFDVWLPSLGARLPVFHYGHGLGSARGEASYEAEILGPSGFAVASVDALHHGDHPTAGDAGSDPIAFLGMDLLNFEIDPLALRGNFQQTPLDRLQLLRLLQTHPDLDGDGVDDLDPTRVGYVGVSLGGLLGPGLLATSDAIEVAQLIVGGGFLMSFATDSAVTELFMPLLVGLVGTPDAYQRFLVVLQAAVDPGDPAVLAAHVMAHRFDDAAPPDLLLQVAEFDDVVPPRAGEMLARGLGLPHVGPVVWDVPGLTPAPAGVLADNGDGFTFGYFQFDRVTDGEELEPAEHGNTPLSAEAIAQGKRFLETWRDGAAAEIIDPYAVLGTPALP